MSVKAKLVLQIVLMGIGLLGVSFFGVVGMKLIAKGNPELNAISSQWMGYMAICGGLVFVLLIIAGIIILLSIDRPLREAVELINRMAAGEMTGRADPRRMKTKGEFGELMTSMNTLAKNLDEILTEVQRGSFALSENMNGALTNLNKLNGEIESVSATTEQLSAGMEETSASAQQVDSMAREIETVSKNIAVRAQEGAEKAADIHQRAMEAKESTTANKAKASNLKNEISVSLKKSLEDAKVVGEIKKLAEAIMGITSQTNLLALNASIEAARACETG